MEYACDPSDKYVLYLAGVRIQIRVLVGFVTGFEIFLALFFYERDDTVLKYQLILTFMSKENS